MKQACIRLDNWLSGSRLYIRGRKCRALLTGVRLKRTRIQIDGSENLLEIAPGTRLFDSSISIRGIGHHVRIGEFCVLGKFCLNVHSQHVSVNIGHRTTSASVSMELGEPNVRLSIGTDCMIAHNVEIMCSDSHALVDAVSRDRINPAADIDIGDHVWLCANTAVLKGAVIGEHVTIGFRSTVVSSIPPYSLAVGSPARVIRSGVSWNRDLK